MPTYVEKNAKTQAKLTAQNLAEPIVAMTVVRRDDLLDSHWEIFLHGQSNVVIKVDLMETAYRVLYDVTLFLGGAAGTAEKLSMDRQVNLGQVIDAVHVVGDRLGNWTGSRTYNCQDFVVGFMMVIGMSDSKIFKYELRRKAMKYQPPIWVTETIGGVQITHETHV